VTGRHEEGAVGVGLEVLHRRHQLGQAGVVAVVELLLALESAAVREELDGALLHGCARVMCLLAALDS
jgi:hypothetical protein